VRERRKARSATDLRRWVERWHAVLDLGWGESEKRDALEYVNARFYGYPRGDGGE